MLRKQVKCLDCGFLGRHDAAPEQESLEIPMSSEERLGYRKLLKDLGMLEPHECTQDQRDRLTAGDYDDRMESSFALLCTRRVWNEIDFWDDGQEEYEIEGFLAAELHPSRRCRLFQKYEAAYSPAEHKELQREARNRRTLMIGMLLAAVIGAGAAIIAGVVVD